MADETKAQRARATAKARAKRGAKPLGSKTWWSWLLSWFVVPLAILFMPLDGEFVGKRLFYHFYLNGIYDPDRDSFVIRELPFTLTQEDIADLMLMVDEYGNVRSNTSTTALLGFQDYEALIPETLKKSVVNGTVAYASQVQRDNPTGAAGMFRVRDRVVERLRAADVMPAEVFGVDGRSAWAAFSVTSMPSVEGSFDWHYDAESPKEYRALFVVHGGDDCGDASVHYYDKNGTIQDNIVKTGHGYLIRGSQTFHSVYNGGCPTEGGTVPFRHMVGFQVSEIPDRWPKPFCYLMLEASATVNQLWVRLFGRPRVFQ
jgi:hypothetical protein